MDSITVRQGDSSNKEIIKHKVEDEFRNNVDKYKLSLQIQNRLNMTVLEKTVQYDEDIDGFAIELLPDETEVFEPGGYLMIANLSKFDDNGKKVFNRQLAWNLNIIEKYGAK